MNSKTLHHDTARIALNCVAWAVKITCLILVAWLIRRIIRKCSVIQRKNDSKDCKLSLYTIQRIGEQVSRELHILLANEYASWTNLLGSLQGLNRCIQIRECAFDREKMNNTSVSKISWRQLVANIQSEHTFFCVDCMITYEMCSEYWKHQGGFCYYQMSNYLFLFHICWFAYSLLKFVPLMLNGNEWKKMALNVIDCV